jgi:cytochrome c peroxidase
VDGFNIPSLSNINLGAPYFHGGSAETLEVLLDPTGDFVSHLQAGNQVYSPDATQLANLIAFLRSIDDSTPTIAVPTNQTFCPIGIIPQ